MATTSPLRAATETSPDAPMKRPRRRWGAALKALRRLLSDKDDTGQVFEIMGALNGGSTSRNYHRLLTTPRGGRLAYERLELASQLMNDAWLDGFAPGTVGAAYREFVQSENISAQGLVDISSTINGRNLILHPYAWMGRRTRDSHDIWHVLSGYHRDALGEACLVAFSYAQTGSLGWAVIAIGAALRGRSGPKYPYSRAIWQGYRRGKAAKWLPGEDYVELFAEPLDAARRRLKITPPTLYDAIPREARELAIPKDEPEALKLAA
jgi:ubiquinone biosynthesis protein COQ4